MFVSKIIKLLQLVKFSINFITLKDLKTNRHNGRGHEHNDLNNFDSNKWVACSASASSLDIHCCLGHPSLQSVKKQIPNLSNVSFLECESCALEKHQQVSSTHKVHKHAFGPLMLSSFWYSESKSCHFKIEFQICCSLCWWFFSQHLALYYERSFQIVFHILFPRL